MFSYVHQTIAKPRLKKLAVTCGELRSTGGTSSRSKFQDKRTLCASALAATSGTAASCRPSVCLDFLNPCLTLSFFRQGYGGGFVALSLSLSLCAHARLSVVGRLAAHARGGKHRNLPLPGLPVSTGSDDRSFDTGVTG